MYFHNIIAHYIPIILKYYRLFENLVFYYCFYHLKTNKKRPSEKIFQTAFFIKCALFNKLRPTSRVCLLSNRIECR